MKKTVKRIVAILKWMVKRLSCKHSYKKICEYSGRHTATNKEVVFEIDYECTCCGKRLTVNMDREIQLK